MTARREKGTGFVLLAGAGVVGLALYNHFRPQIDQGLSDVGRLIPGLEPTPAAPVPIAHPPPAAPVPSPTPPVLQPSTPIPAPTPTPTPAPVPVPGAPDIGSPFPPPRPAPAPSPPAPILQPSRPIAPPARGPVDPQDFITAEYQTVLHRAPDSSGDAYWLSVIADQRAAGVPEPQIVANIEAAFANSPEALAAGG